MARPTAEEFEQLPFYGWLARPDSLPLDIEEIRSALFIWNGDIEAAAGLLKVTAAQLKKPIRKSPHLQRLIKRLREPS
jgi:hypothetical protein